MNFDEHREQFQKELVRLIGQRNELDRKIHGLIKAIEGLNVITGNSGPPPPPSDLVLVPAASGFTDRVRAVFRSDTSRSWTPVQVRDRLVESGVSNTKQLLIQVHNTVDRLLKQDEIRPEGNGYKWITSLYRALLGITNQQPEVPNPFGRNLAEMLKEPRKKK
jgi:hypothetical protein